MAAGENRFAPELNEKEVIELFEDLDVFNKTIIPLAHVGYEMVIAIYHLISNARSRNNCYIFIQHF